MGKIPINTPRDRDRSFNPLIVQKRKTDITGIEKKVLSMYENVFFEMLERIIQLENEKE